MSCKFSAWRSFTVEKHTTWTHPCLEKRPSNIPGAGFGVFATEDIPKGAHLGYFVGIVYWVYPDKNDRDHAYLLEVSHRPAWILPHVWRKNRRNQEAPVVDVKRSCILGYINCCKGDMRKMNADFSRSGQFATIKSIRKGTELLINYGKKDYWDTLESSESEV
jgi:hypothetical protein